MLARLRTHFGTAGLVVAIVALIAALGGGAYAATNSDTSGKATASAKAKQGPRGKTGKTGKTGPTGPAGPAGLAGPQGAAGANGKDGANGAAGSNGATGATGPTGKQGNAGLPGEAGPTGPTGTFGGITLPAGVTETGYWSFSTGGTNTIEEGDGDPVTIGSSDAYASFSFPDRVAAAVSMFVRYQTTDPEFATTCGTGTGGAGGKAISPKAPPNTLCIWQFTASMANATFASVCPTIACEASGFNDMGGTLKFTLPGEGPAQGSGSWAVTG
jgi:hypothetical protein